MLTTIYSKSGKLFPIALVVFAIAFLASCSSSNQFASSFSKRKYTNGHFSDPVAKVKASDKPGNYNSSNLNTRVTNNLVANNAVIHQNQEKAIKVNFSHPVKSEYAKKDKPAIASIVKFKNDIFSVTKSQVADNNAPYAAFRETSTIQDSPAYGDHGGNGGRENGHHHYLLDCLLCILLWLVFLILAAASVVSGSGACLGLFAILAYIAAIAALVFFILWIVDIAS